MHLYLDFTCSLNHQVCLIEFLFVMSIFRSIKNFFSFAFLFTQTKGPLEMIQQNVFYSLSAMNIPPHLSCFRFVFQFPLSIFISEISLSEKNPVELNEKTNSIKANSILNKIRTFKKCLTCSLYSSLK